MEAHTFLEIGSASFFLCIHFVQFAILFDCCLWSCLCELNGFVDFSPFLFHSFTHTLDHLAFKQMYNDSTWRGQVIWASEPRMSLVSTCSGYSSSLLFVLFFPDLSITNSASCRNGVTGGPCTHLSEIDRQSSQEAHCCSGHICWSTALQKLHIPSLLSPLHPCEEPSPIHSPPNCFFSLAHTPGKPGHLQNFIVCFRK